MTPKEKRAFLTSIMQNVYMIDRRLQMLRMLAAHGTVSAAAESLHYTPSAVSHQLRTLAEDLGVTLITHHGRGVRLTPTARTLLARSDALFAMWEEIQAELAATAGEATGTLRLCGFSSAAAALLPTVAVRLHEVHPNLIVRIIEAAPADCFDLLLADQADVAVVVALPDLPPTIDPRFDQRLLLDDPLDLLVPANHPLASRQSVSLEEAADQLWIVDHPGTAYYQLVLTACAVAGFTPAVAHEAVEWDTGAALVAAELGIALVPRLAQIPSGYAISRVPLRGDPSPARHILTSVRRGSREQPIIAEALGALTDLANQARHRDLAAQPD